MTALQNLRNSHGCRKNHDEESASGRGGVLHYLYAHNGTASPGELCSHLGVTTPRVTVVLNELEKEQLITRETAAYDHRRIFVHLTAEGNEHVEQWQARKRERILELVAHLSEDDAQALLRICPVMERMAKDKDYC
ncbi:MAG: MarR family transcriptional regulator [Lachnospiraceae bacterium]|nr:MarR family transcriptional regulator [Lachnospiraceae bacterium]